MTTKKSSILHTNMRVRPVPSNLNTYPVHPNRQVDVVAPKVGNLATTASVPRPPMCAALGTPDQTIFPGDEELRYKTVPNSCDLEHNRK